MKGFSSTIPIYHLLCLAFDDRRESVNKELERSTIRISKKNLKAYGGHQDEKFGSDKKLVLQVEVVYWLIVVRMGYL